LEYNRPTVEDAVRSMKNSLTTLKGQGYKAVILIHGYGSSGSGGAIKPAVKRCLGEPGMRGIVRTFVGGEQWLDRKQEMLGICKSLESYQQRISGNDGVTVVILR
jgi:DNA-nicking Smr family endonuclease